MIKEKNIIFKGGLGNQLFQYSFGEYLRKNFDYKVSFNNYLYSDLKYNLKNTNRDLTIVKYINRKININSKKIQNSKFLQLFEPIIIFFLKKKIPLPGKILNGYWQDIKFAKAINKSYLKRSFEFLPKDIKVKDPFFIHGRFGDFRYTKINYCLDEDYYFKSISYLQKKIGNKITFYLISDDNKYFNKIMKNIIKKKNMCTFIFKEYNEVDAVKLMINASGGICSNSTFSWWCALLSESSKKNFVFPNLWLKNKTIKQLNLEILETKIV